MSKEDIIRKLTSRKLWLAVAAFVSGIVAVFCGDKTAQIVGGLILQLAAVVAYICGEGLVDAANKPSDYGDAGEHTVVPAHYYVSEGKTGTSSLFHGTKAAEDSGHPPDEEEELAAEECGWIGGDGNG